MSSNRFLSISLVWFVPVVMGFVACHGGDAAQGSGSGLVEQTTLPPSPEEIGEEQVAALEAVSPETVLTRAQELVTPAELATEAEDALASFDPLIRELVIELYQERSWQPIFVDEASLTAEGEAVLNTLGDTWAHGLFAEDYGVPQLETLQATIEAAVVLTENYAGITFDEVERAELVAFIAARPDLSDLELEEDARSEAVLELLLITDGEGPVAGPTESYAALVSAMQAREDATAAIELTLAAGFLKYAQDMRYFNTAWYGEEALGDEQINLPVLTRDALRNSFRIAADGTNPEGFAEAMAEVVPPYPEYAPMVEWHRVYREFVNNGGWDGLEVVETEMRIGREYDIVPTLRQRLAAEDYFEGDVESRVFDDEVRSAIRAYQTTHQFREDGILDEDLAGSLNTPAINRARQISLALQRWRESPIGGASHYVIMNIPEFHTEVWRNGVREMRFRTIVGATQRFTRRATGELVFPRATPEFTELLRYIVFNPYWNVPQGIMTNEYDPNLAENPLWYEENGYEVLYNESGTRRVRQLPGPGNALGIVKFLFPNTHDVYMHDTPNKSLFERTFRAFSHGCMRIQDPMEFAVYLLGTDRGWERERVFEQLEDGAEQWITLRDPVRVTVGYFVASLGEGNELLFLSDLYRRDRPRLEEIATREEAVAFQTATGALEGTLAVAANRADSPESVATPTPQGDTDVANTDVANTDVANTDVANTDVAEAQVP